MEILWDISTKCNLNCKHCGEADYLKTASALGHEEILLIAKNLSEIATSVTLLGGEPLLATAIEEVVDIFLKKNIGVKLITNGQIYNPVIERILARKNITHIFVSIDGMEEDNDYVRGIGTWKRAVNFLEKIVTVKSPRTVVGISMVLHKKSVQHINDFLEYFRLLNVDSLSINLLDISGDATQHREELFLDDETVLKSLEHIAQWSIRTGTNVSIDSGYEDVDKYLQITTGYISHSNPKRCGALFESGFCDMRGYFYPCRKYCTTGSGIDLKKPISWNAEYNLFNEFLEVALCSDDPQRVICPLGRHTDSSLALLARNKLESLSMLTYSVGQAIIFYEISDRFFIIFPKNNEFVEYTKEGFLIYKMLYSNSNLHTIASCLGCTIEDVRTFLSEECSNGRIMRTISSV